MTIYKQFLFFSCSIFNGNKGKKSFRNYDTYYDYY